MSLRVTIVSYLNDVLFGQLGSVLSLCFCTAVFSVWCAPSHLVNHPLFKIHPKSMSCPSQNHSLPLPSLPLLAQQTRWLFLSHPWHLEIASLQQWSNCAVIFYGTACFPRQAESSLRTGITPESGQGPRSSHTCHPADAKNDGFG